MFINKTPTANGNYGNPRSNGGGLLLPDNLLPTYLDSMGFVNITHDGETVLTVERNEDAYNAYIESLPPAPPPEPSEQDKLEAQVLYTALMTDTLLEEDIEDV